MTIATTLSGRSLLTLLFLAALTFSQSALSAGSGHVKWGKLPTLSVIADGKEYTQIEPAVGAAWEAEFEITTGAGKVKSWEIYPYKPQQIGSPELNLKLYSASKSYPFGNRPDSVHKTVGEIFPISEIAPYAIARCNHNLYLLRNQGLSDGEIFAQEHKISDQFYINLSADITIGGFFTEGQVHTVDVICLAHDAPEPPPPVTDKLVSPTFQVTGASLQVLLDGHPIPTKAERDCPAELNFLGHIQVTGTAVPATVQYRFEFASGNKSNVFSTVVNHTDASALISHQVAIPLTAAFGGGGGGVEPGAGGFQVQQLPDPDQPQPPPQQVSGFADAQLPGNEHKDSARLVVLTHGGAVSGPAGYHIVCMPKVTEGIRGATGLTLPAPAPEPAPRDAQLRSDQPATAPHEILPQVIRGRMESDQPASREAVEEQPTSDRYRMQTR